MVLQTNFSNFLFLTKKRAYPHAMKPRPNTLYRARPVRLKAIRDLLPDRQSMI